MSGAAAAAPARTPGSLRVAAVLLGVMAALFVLGGVRGVLQGVAVTSIVRLLLGAALAWMTVGLLKTRRWAWTWSVAFCVLRLAGWLAFAFVFAPAYDSAVPLSAWFAPRALLEQAPVATALVLLLLPASRRSVGTGLTP